MSGFERPAPDINKIVEAWNTWTTGGDDVLPGRTMADLKIGGVDRLLAAIAEDTPDALGEVLDAWNLWERGKVGPVDTLAALTQHGFADVVEELAASS